MLHSDNQRVTIIQICSPFFFARILPES